MAEGQQDALVSIEKSLQSMTYTQDHHSLNRSRDHNNALLGVIFHSFGKT